MKLLLEREKPAHIEKLVALNKRRSAHLRSEREGKTSKVCGVCRVLTPLDLFGRQTKTWDGLQSRCRDCARRVNRLQAREKIKRLRGLVFEMLGHSCKRCGFTDKRALQIDHVFGGGKEDNDSHRGVRFYQKILASNGEKYQILCANCNWIKRAENGETPKRIGNEVAA